MTPTMIMHPLNSSLDGKDLSDIQDTNGKHFFNEFVDIVWQQQGYVEYYWLWGLY